MTAADPFADAPMISDGVVLAIDFAETVEETHFANVVNFHGDTVNGGLDQALYNLGVRQRRGGPSLTEVLAGYRAMGMDCIATVIEIARREGRVATIWRDIFGRPPNDMDAVYYALAYSLPHAVQGAYGMSEFADLVEGSDWVERLALKYARNHRDQFGTIAGSIA